jgi:predicted DCC family thiol-disulfide oxidoreductase YuxK
MDDKLIILFDGVCNFCNFWVNYIIDRDKNDKFRFAALQSEFGQDTLKKLNLSQTDFDTFVLISGEKHYIKSTAGLLVAKNLGGRLSLLYPLIIIPSFIRNFVYSLIAKNRYKFFGKEDACRIPTPELKKKFIGN